MWNSRRSHQRAAARLPDGLRVYAIGDIHGRADLLEALLAQIDVDCALYPSSRPIVVFLGDYIDRGPGSSEVLDLLLACGRTRETVFLRGNHETFVHRFLSEPAILDEWRLCGGLETLMSYGLKPSINPDAAEQTRLAEELARSIPQRHLEFLDSPRSVVQLWGFSVCPCRHSSRRRHSQTAGRRSALDSRRVSVLRAAVREICGARAYPGACARYPIEPGQYRHRRVCNGTPDLHRDRRQRDRTVDRCPRLGAHHRRHPRYAADADRACGADPGDLEARYLRTPLAPHASRPREATGSRFGKPKAMVSGPSEIVDPSETIAPVHRSLKALSA